MSAILVGCQTRETVVTPPVRETAGKTVTAPRQFTTVTGFNQAPDAGLSVSPSKEVAEPTLQVEVPPPAIPRELQLPAQLPNCRIEPISKNVWRATPLRKSFQDPAASLMEDAIISSKIHARLKSIPVPWQYSSNAGIVTLNTPSLSRGQAIAAIQTVLTIEKVSEVRLTTTLRD